MNAISFFLINSLVWCTQQEFIRRTGWHKVQKSLRLKEGSRKVKRIALREDQEETENVKLSPYIENNHAFGSTVPPSQLAFFRVVLHLSNLEYDLQFNDVDSFQFQLEAIDFAQAIEQEFVNDSFVQYVSVIRFQPAADTGNGSYVTFDIAALDHEQETSFKSKLEELIENGKLKHYRLTKLNFYFQRVDVLNGRTVANQSDCDGGHFKCKADICLPVNKLCDGKIDCPEGDDERNCEKLRKDVHRLHFYLPNLKFQEEFGDPGSEFFKATASIVVQQLKDAYPDFPPSVMRLSNIQPAVNGESGAYATIYIYPERTTDEFLLRDYVEKVRENTVSGHFNLGRSKFDNVAPPVAYHRIKLHIPNIEFRPDFGDRSSPVFHWLEARLSNAIRKVYPYVTSSDELRIIEIGQANDIELGIYVVFDLPVKGEEGNSLIKNLMNRTVANQSLHDLELTKAQFSYQKIQAERSHVMPVVISSATENLIANEDAKDSTALNPCDTNFYRCLNGKCLETEKLCNGIPDCLHEDDEANCSSIIPKTLFHVKLHLKNYEYDVVDSNVTQPRLTAKYHTAMLNKLISELSSALFNSPDFKPTHVVNLEPAKSYKTYKGIYVTVNIVSFKDQPKIVLQKMLQQIINNGTLDDLQVSDRVIEVRKVSGLYKVRLILAQLNLNATMTNNKSPALQPTANMLKKELKKLLAFINAVIYFDKVEMQPKKEPDSGVSATFLIGALKGHAPIDKILYEAISNNSIGKFRIIRSEIEELRNESFVDISQALNDHHGSCMPDFLRCKSGHCLQVNRWCDTVPDCPNGDDEADCDHEVKIFQPLGCRPDQFRCLYTGECIDGKKKCDGNYDCKDCSDERDCEFVPCRKGDFKCSSGECIAQNERCDESLDCKDGSDELNCIQSTLLCPDGTPPETAKFGGNYCWTSAVCPSSTICLNGLCCRPKNREITGCHPTEQFQCLSTMTCVPKSALCNGNYDCKDGSDELISICGERHPSSCYPTQFRCGSGECINIEYKCNGANECRDSSDELHCMQSHVHTTTHGDDEVVERLKCGQNEFQCISSKICIDSRHRCNNISDCPDGSDEKDCSSSVVLQCHKGEFVCSNSRRCIPELYVCDRIYDCSDKSDEAHCSYASATASELIPDFNMGAACKRNEFRCNNGHCIQTELRCNGEKNCIDSSDEYGCEISSSGCLHNQYRCRDGKTCIPSTSVCDGVYDCPDNSDEFQCLGPKDVEKCNEHQFRCGDSHCIENFRRCDSNADCADSSDEIGCNFENPRLCVATEYPCSNGQCIPFGKRCDLKVDCTDKSDEINCRRKGGHHISYSAFTCFLDEFKCDDGFCILGDLRCNGASDCRDDSDERNCGQSGWVSTSPAAITKSLICSGDDFKCFDGLKCIRERYYCDGRLDCMDGSDERNCTIGGIKHSTRLCAHDQFNCINGHCIPIGAHCDGVEDCSDGSDERGCTSATTTGIQCASGEFRCHSGECLAGEKVCDVVHDCRDGSDEINCVATIKPCSNQEFACNDGSCIDLRLRCNYRFDCSDLSDEINCSTSLSTTQSSVEQIQCSASMFRCGDGKCINSILKCNGKIDCEDGSDEANLACGLAKCPISQFQCEINGFCLSKIKKCDGIPDCLDHSDEVNCESEYVDKLVVEVQPVKFKTVRISDTVSANCRASGLARLGGTKWFFGFGEQNLPDGVLDKDGQLIVLNAQLYHNGTYVCRTIGAPITKSITFQLTVSPVSEGGRGFCGPDEATCRNGECVKRENICDGEYDCRDRSDESNCGSQRQCEPNEFLCHNRHCVQKMWVCDGEDDCGDNSDERECGAAAPGELCAPYQFRCQRSEQCIPKNYQCDGQNDCQDGSDEIGCSDPVVVQLPEPSKTICLGETLTLNCRAVGVPVPLITWRLNWGAVCDPPRCTQTSLNGYGVLTINNINEGDQGAYSCEAINSRKRILASPDAIVTVRRCDVTEPPYQEPQSLCNTAGTATRVPDGRCRCKPYVIGPYCDRCADYSYNLAPTNPQGCIRCFCMGVTRQCQSSDYYRLQQKLTFRGESQGVVSSDFAERQIEQNPVFDYTVVPNAITLRSAYQPTTNYWRLPASFLGNKLTSYGGALKFVIQYSGQGPPPPDPLVALKGNEIILVHRTDARLDSDRLVPINVHIVETSFTREDGQPATREHLLMTLAGLESLLIRQTHCQYQQSSSLGEVSLDVAQPQYTGQERAEAVEKCSCPTGYIGQSCEECAPGYQRSGGGLYLGNCILADHHEQVLPPTRPPWRPNPQQCNPSGSLSPWPDPRTGRCSCKEQTTGHLCDQCRPYTFYLDQRNPHGCIMCFCSGVTKDCQSSSLHRQEQSVSNFRDWVVPIRTGEAANYETLLTPAMESEDGRALKFESFHQFADGRALYIEMPDQFHGNKITAYGGKLRIRFTYSAQGSIDDQNPCVVIRGNDISLYHTTQDSIHPDRENVLVIPLYENYWQREDRYPSTREHLLMTLADLNALLIKITWKQSMQSFTLLEVSLDYASHVPSHFGVASAVEQCRCPEGYVGSSCEDCATGYTRTGGGLYLGLCEACFCNGHSDECHPEHGQCKDCQHNTDGMQCEVCRPGYHGDATRGTPHDCQPSNHLRPDPWQPAHPPYWPHPERPDHGYQFQGEISEPTAAPEESFTEPTTEATTTEAGVEPTDQAEPEPTLELTTEAVAEATTETATESSTESVAETTTTKSMGEFVVDELTAESVTDESTAESAVESTTTDADAHDDADYATDVDDVDHPGDRGDKPQETDTEVPTTDDEATTTAVADSKCTKCECHEHSPKGCDDDCKCIECDDNTEGEHCEKCKSGFYGDATSSTPFDCQECPCPKAAGCILDTDGYITCRGCPEGYAGRLCTDCAPGFAYDPEDPNKCKPEEATRRRKLRKHRKLLHRAYRT